MTIAGAVIAASAWVLALIAFEVMRIKEDKLSYLLLVIVITGITVLICGIVMQAKEKSQLKKEQRESTDVSKEQKNTGTSIPSKQTVSESALTKFLREFFRAIPKKFALCLVMCIVIIIGLAIGVSLKINSTVGAICIMIAALGSMVGVESIYSQISLENEQYIIFDKENETAKILRRSARSAALLRMEQIQKTYTEHHGPELVYTGATVGGVHTGGFHTTKAYLSEKGQGPSGRYYIMTKLNDGTVVILKKILLSQALLEEARKCDAIRKFIVADGLELKYNTPDTELTSAEQDILRQAILRGDQATQYNITQRAFLASHLTKEDCAAILNWVKGT